MKAGLKAFLDTLTPEDIGCVHFGSRVVRFEGFTDECWFDAITLGKARESLEAEVLDGWFRMGETQGKELIENGWWTEDIFYAVYASR